MLYLVLKTFHVLAVAAAIGTNVTYGFILSRAGRSPHALFALRTVAFLDAKVANTAYGLAFVSGAVLVRVGGLPWSTPWVAFSIGLFALTAVVGFAVYTPTLRRQLAVLEAEGADSPDYRRVARRGQWVGGLLSAVVLVIVALMVCKPV